MTRRRNVSRKTLAFAGITLVAALGLTACGGGDDDAPPVDQAPSGSTPAPTEQTMPPETTAPPAPETTAPPSSDSPTPGGDATQEPMPESTPDDAGSVPEADPQSGTLEGDVDGGASSEDDTTTTP